jgi:hypothetical protein
VNIAQKNSIVCGTDGTSGFASSSNQMVLSSLCVLLSCCQYSAVSRLCSNNFCL